MKNGTSRWAVVWFKKAAAQEYIFPHSQNLELSAQGLELLEIEVSAAVLVDPKI